MRAHAPSLVIAAALCCLIASLGAAPPASAVEEAPASAEAEEATPTLDEGAQDAGEAPQAPDEAEPADKAGARGGADEKIEQLYVTATKREESIQDVAISMAALDASFLESSGTTSMGQLQQYVPNLTINPITDTRGTVFRIRGIGSVGNNSGIDPSVGVFIDGVYQGRAGMSVADLLDVERVEVLRGPQGTLYGKNTAAGLIHIVSKRPSYEPEATLEGVFGNYADYEGRGSVNIPLWDEHIATRLSGYRVIRDGFDYNAWLGEKVNDDNRWGVKSRTVFDVTDSFSTLLTLDYSYQDNQCCVADTITYNGFPTLQDGFRKPAVDPSSPLYDPDFPPLPDPLTYPIDPENYPGTITSPGPDPRWARRTSFQMLEILRQEENPEFRLPEADPFDRTIHNDVEPKNEVTIGGASIDATYDIGAFADIPFLDEASLNFIGAWRHYESNSQFDGDFSLFDVSIAWTETQLDQFSAELRLSSPGGEVFDYQVGLYFYHQTQDTRDRLGFEDEFHPTWTLILNKALNIGNNIHETTSYAGFGQFTLTPVEWFSFTGGLRVTTEKKTREGAQLGEYFHWGNVSNPNSAAYNFRGINVCGLEWYDGVDDPSAPRWNVPPPFDTPITDAEAQFNCRDAPPILGPPTSRGVALDPQPVADAAGNPLSLPGQSREVANVSWLANLRFFPTEDLMLYASAATGFKSGGFNQLRTTAVTPGEFDDERSLNIEGGFKSSWFERMLTLNATGFWTEYKDFQAQVFNGAEVNVINAATLESYGAEADLVLVPHEYLILGGSLGFNILKYGSFTNGLSTAQQKWEKNLFHSDGMMACGIKGPDGAGLTPNSDPGYEGWDTQSGEWAERCAQDLTGRIADNAPKWSVSTWAQTQYLLPWWPLESILGSGEAFLRAEYAYTSGRYLDADLDPNLYQPANHLLNLRGGMRAENGRWEVTAWVKNLTDEKYNVVGFDMPTMNGFSAMNGPPRQWGFTVRVNFGALVD